MCLGLNWNLGCVMVFIIGIGVEITKENGREDKCHKISIQREV